MPDPVLTSAPEPTPTTRVVDRQGRVFEGDGAQVASLLEQRDPTGAALFELDTPERAEERRLQREYGGRSVEAGLVGAARGATMGLSDVALAPVLGEERLREVGERNAVAAGVGEVGGALAPLLFSGGGTGLARAGLEGAALATEGARGTSALGAVLRGVSAPSRFVARAAEGAEALVGSGLAARGTAGLGRRALTRAASMGAGGAVEGAAMGLQQSITESVLGDEEMTAQSVMANVGLNALLGGAGGALFGVGVEGLATAGRGTRDVIGRAFRDATGQDLRRGVAEAWDAGARGVAGASSLVTGAEQRTIREALGPEGRELRQLIARGDDVYEEASRGITQALTEAEGATRHVSDLWGRGMKREQIRGLVSTERLAEQVQSAATHVTGIRRLAESVIGDSQRGATFEAAGVAGRARDLLRSVGAAEEMLARTVQRTDAADVSTDLFQALDELKRGIGDVQRRVERVDRGSSFLQQLRGDDGYEGIRRTLEDANLWGEGAAGAQTEVNRAFTRFLERRQTFVRDFLTDGARDTIDPFRRLPAADSARIDGFLRAAGAARNDTRAQTFREVLDAQAELAEAMGRHLDLGELAPEATAAASNARKARALFDETEDRVARVNQFRALESGTGVERALTAQAAGFVAGGPLGAAIATALASPTTLARGLGAIERAVQRVGLRMDRGVSSYVSRALDAARTASRRAAVAGSRVARRSVAMVSVGEFHEEVARVIEASAHPERTSARIAESTGEIGQAAPRVQGVLAARATAGLGFLAQRIPPAARPMDGMLPGMSARRREASSPERARFMRYVRAVNDPLSNLEVGSIPPESVEVLRELYPAIHQAVGVRFAEELASRARDGDEVPYSFRRDLGVLLGAATDPALRPAALMDYQAAVASSAQDAKALEQRRTNGGAAAPRNGRALGAIGEETGPALMTRNQRREIANGG